MGSTEAPYSGKTDSEGGSNFKKTPKFSKLLNKI